MSVEKPSAYKLNNHNYEIWNVIMSALLTRKGLLEVIAPNAAAPLTGPNSPAGKAWTRKNAEARAELILNVEIDQLAHMMAPLAKDIWAELERIHRARGLASRLAMRRRFLSLRMKPAQHMSDWVAEVRTVAFQLRAISVNLDDEDLILVLTMGLPRTYKTLVVALDSLPADELTLDNVISRLLNEESRIRAEAESDDEATQNVAMAVTPAAPSQPARPPRVGIAHITCYTCGHKGHFQANCPTRAANASNTAAASSSTGGFAAVVEDDSADESDGVW